MGRLVGDFQPTKAPRKKRRRPPYMGRERRRRERHHVPHAFARFQKRILCFPAGLLSEEYPIRNINSRGISFRSMSPVRAGDKLLVQLETSVLVHSFWSKCRFLVRVVWVDKLPKKTYWRVGCTILEKKARQEIVRLIQDGLIVPLRRERFVE